MSKQTEERIIKSFKIDGKKAVVDYDKVITLENGQKYKKNIPETSDAPIHPALKDCLEGLIPSIMKVEDYKKGVESSITVTGVKWQGDEDSPCVYISWTKTAKNGMTQGRSTPKVMLHDNKFGIEEDIQLFTDKLREECVKYVDLECVQLALDFNFKQGQTEGDSEVSKVDGQESSSEEPVAGKMEEVAA